jgi:putative effector of murein hydrolase
VNEALAFLMPIAGIALAAALYAAAQSVRDFQRQNLLWGTAGGAVSAALFWVAGTILLTPVETHAVKIDLPRL